MIKIFLFLTILLLSLVVTTTVSAAAQIPERNGDYPDPEHPGVRVRVFIHEAKGPQPLTLSPVFSCTDSDSSAIVNPTGWRLPTGIWTYQLNISSVPSSVGSDNLVTIANNAFNAWQAAQNKVTFVRGINTFANKQSLDFKNIVSWGRTSGIALAVTYTRYYTATNLVADVDTIMNQKFVWSWTDPSVNSCSLYSTAYDAQNILTHELGHWMGLDDEYTQDFIDNTLYGYGSKGEVKKNTLTSGDITGAQAIYP